MKKTFKEILINQLKMRLDVAVNTLARITVDTNETEFEVARWEARIAQLREVIALVESLSREVAE